MLSCLFFKLHAMNSFGLFLSLFYLENPNSKRQFASSSYEVKTWHLDRTSTVRLTQKYPLFLIPHQSRSCREIANSESPPDPQVPPNLSAPLYFLTGNSLVFIINFSIEVFSFYSVKFHPISLITVFNVSNQQNEWTLQKYWFLCSMRA